MVWRNRTAGVWKGQVLACDEVRMRTMPHTILLRPAVARLFVILSLAAPSAPAAEQATNTNAVRIADHYTKYEHRIPDARRGAAQSTQNTRVRRTCFQCSEPV